MTRQIVLIKGRKFLVLNIIKLSKTYNVLGFWETSPGKWAEHVSALDLPHSEWDALPSA